MKTIRYENFQTFNANFPTQIPANHLADALNMVRRNDGMWENRKGMQQFGEDIGSGEPVHSIFFWKTTAGARYLTVGTGVDIYSYTEGSTYNNGTYTDRATLSSSAPWDAIVYRDICVLGNGVSDNQSSTDNVTFTARAGANTVKAKYFEVSNDYVSFSGIVAEPDSVYFSGGAPTNPWEYNGSNTKKLDIGNSDVITGTLALGQNFITAKTRQTYTIQLADLSSETLDFGGGTESNRSMVRTNKNNLYYASKQGIYSLAKTQIGNNQIFAKSESDFIQPLYELTEDFSLINGVYTFEENYGLWTNNTSLGTVTFVRHFHYDEPVWSYLYGINGLDWTIYQDANGNNHYLFADAATDKIWEMFVGRNDNGAPILSRISGKRDDFGQPGLGKQVMYVDFYGYISENAEWNVELYKDDDRTSFVSGVTINNENIQLDLFGGLGTATIGTEPIGGYVSSVDDIAVYPFYCRIPIDQTIEKLQWSLMNNQLDARVILRSVVVYFENEPVDYYPNQFIK